MYFSHRSGGSITCESQSTTKSLADESIAASDDLAFAQRGEFVVAETKFATINGIVVSAKQRTGRARDRGLAIEPQRRAENGDGAELRMLDLLERATLEHVRIGHDLGQFLDDAADDVVGGKLIHQLLAGFGASPFADKAIDLVAMMRSAGKLGEARVVGDFGFAHQGTEFVPALIIGGKNHHPAVAGGISVGRRNDAAGTAIALAQLPNAHAVICADV